MLLVNAPLTNFATPAAWQRKYLVAAGVLEAAAGMCWGSPGGLRSRSPSKVGKSLQTNTNFSDCGSRNGIIIYLLRTEVSNTSSD